MIFTYRGNKFKPYSLCHIRTERVKNYNKTETSKLKTETLEKNTSEENDFLITWEKRTRIGGEWRDNVDILLGEIKEQYKIEIIEPIRNKVVRTIVVNNDVNTNNNINIYNYTAEQQVEDFGAVQNNIKFRICQISSVIGEGYGKVVMG